jgi:hypothetical protein
VGELDNSEASNERRGGQVAIPDDIKSRLNEFQHQTLARLEGFGWSVAFVRRPLFQDQVIVLFDPAGRQHAILNDDGTIDKTTDVQIR